MDANVVWFGMIVALIVVPTGVFFSLALVRRRRFIREYLERVKR